MTGHPCSHRKLSRRQFIKWGGITSAALAMTACQADFPKLPTPTVTPLPSATHTTVPSPVPVTPTAPIPTATATVIPHAGVATSHVQDYTPQHVRHALEGMLDQLGGLGDIIRPGSRVGIKVNMTGSSAWDGPDKPPANEYFVTHPQVAGSLAELCLDLGASQVSFMDGIAEPACFEKWGFSQVAQPLGVKLVNLNQPDPYPGYNRFPVSTNPFFYEWFYLHPALGEIDVLISLGKLKVHSAAGVTLALKNLIGLAAIDEYKREPADTFRSAFHGAYAFDTRLTRVILDLNRACPVHFAVIDGISTCEGGAGPWDPISQVHPGVLIAGRDPVATDAIGTAIMGFDPGAADQSLPFTRCENYLRMANEIGLGENRLENIPVLGESIETLRSPFRPV